MQNHDTGWCMEQLYIYLNADARIATDGLVDFSAQCVNIRKEEKTDFREFAYPFKSQATPYVFKWVYQLENVFKRFKFTNDAFSDDYLKSETVRKFAETQVRLPSTLPNSPVIRAVLAEARKICKKVLGEYSLQRHIELCTFGKNSTVGVKASEAYPDQRLNRPLSGSEQHIHWFITNVLQGDEILQRCLYHTFKKDPMDPLGGRYTQCATLRLSDVPKSYKANRGVMPHTEIGNFFTSGLGFYIVEQLESYGIRLRYLQKEHRKWAKAFSKSRTHVTADLSAASDSFTSNLVNALVPREWYNVLKHGRIKHYDSHGCKAKYMQTFMTMGIGYTFPLQTLLFYSLLKACSNLLNVDGVVSVFGDDLIYPKKIDKCVRFVLTNLGFVLNLDKTFKRDHFRESCGGDYFKGIAVRPFQPEGVQQQLNGTAYSSFLYKLVNGLLARWEYEEIPLTLSFLVKELMKSGNMILQVPYSFPDGSGWKVKRYVKSECFSQIQYSVKKQCSMFYYIASKSNDVPVVQQYPWYWDFFNSRPEIGRPYSMYTVVTPPIRWVVRNTKTQPNKKAGRDCSTQIKLKPVIPKKGAIKYVRQLAQASTWDLGA